MRARSLLLLPLLLVPCVSRAGTIFVDFQLSASTIHALGGLLAVPPDGAITGGSVTLAVPGTDLATPTAGAAEITALSLAADFSKSQFGVTLSGTFAFGQTGSTAATLGSNLATLDVPELAAALTVHVECSGANCGLLGTFPMNQSESRSFGSTQLTLEDLIQPGMASLFGTIESAPGQPLIELVAKETGRSFVVPEPATGTLALFGLTALAGVTRRTR